MSTHEDTQIDGTQPRETAAVPGDVAPFEPATPPEPASPEPTKRSRGERRADKRAARRGSAAADADGASDPVEKLSWWHSSHPVFTPVAGFFTGLLTLVLVPSIFGAIVGKLFSYDTAQRLAPYVLVIFAIPLLLIAVPKSRRFGLFMLVGMLATAVVALVAAGLTLWYLFSHK